MKPVNCVKFARQQFSEIDNQRHKICPQRWIIRDKVCRQRKKRILELALTWFRKKAHPIKDAAW